MCGIAGTVAPAAFGAPADLGEPLAQLRHRGPDSSGIFGDATAVIGQTRLAVIDLVRGDPPQTNEDGTIGVALNGEIYNYGRLREQLHARGHRFRSAGDTEVIAHLAEDGDAVATARALHGMFAFAIWDRGRQRLTLARDRVGKKPLYYWCRHGRLVFGSEIKAILAASEVPRELNERALPAYLAFGYVPTPQTFFSGIRSVPPGHVLSFEPGGEPVLERYWRPPVAARDGVRPAAVTLAEAGTELRSGLTAAVKRRLVADVPIGAFLSGGVDSSAVVGIMAQLSAEPVKTFTIGFDDNDGFDERPYARMVAQRFGTEHHEHVVHPDAVALIERLVWHHDQPFGDSSAIPTFLISEMTRREVTVALSGDGGDELFAGYERFAAALLAQRFRGVPAPLRNLAKGAVGVFPRSALGGRSASLQRFLAHAAESLPGGYRAWVSFLQEPELRQALGQPDAWGQRDYEGIWAESAPAPLLDRLLDLNMRTYLLDDLLVKADRMSMAHGLEVRSPFLDTDLITLASRIPAPLKLRRLARKRVLMEAVKDLIPPEILHRRKRGFAVPLDRWFRGELRDYATSMLGGPDGRVRRWLAPEMVDRLLREHTSGACSRGQVLWLLLTLEVFLRRENW